MTPVVAALSGSVIGLGSWLALMGLRGTALLGRGGRGRVAGSSLGLSWAAAGSASNAGFSVRKIAISLAMAGLVYVVTGWIALALLVGGSIMIFWGRLSPNKHTAALADRGDAIASWIEMLFGTIAAGGGFEKAIAVSARSAPKPIRPEVERLAARIEVVPLPQALRDFAKDIAHPACDKVATALTLASARGAQNIVSLLRSQAASVRQDSQLLRSQQAGRSKFLTSARIILGSTLAVAAGIYLFDDGYLEPYGTAFGQLMLAAVGAGFMGGYAMLVKMGQSKPPQRYFEMKDAEASQTENPVAPQITDPVASQLANIQTSQMTGKAASLGVQL